MQVVLVFGVLRFLGLAGYLLQQVLLLVCEIAGYGCLMYILVFDSMWVLCFSLELGSSCLGQGFW